MESFIGREQTTQTVVEATHSCGCKKGSAMLQRILEEPGSFARQFNRAPFMSGVDVIARPGEPLPTQPLQGDILIRIIEGGSGHAAVVASPGLWLPEDLADRGLHAEKASAGGHVHVEERYPIRREASEGFARRMTDSTGRLLEDLLLIRLATPPPTVIKVEQPSAVPSVQSVTDTPVADATSIEPESLGMSGSGTLEAASAVGEPEQADEIDSESRALLIPPVDAAPQQLDVEASGPSGRAASRTPPPQGKGQTSTPAAVTGASLPLEVKLVGQVCVYKANDQWAPEGPPIVPPLFFNPGRISGGDWFIPRLEIPINFDTPTPFPERTIFEIRASNVSDPKTLRSQAFFWRCVATHAAGIKSLDPLGSQPGNVPSSPFISSPSGDSPVLGPLQGTVIPSSTPATRTTIQATSQIQGASSVLQVQGGLSLDPGGPAKLLEKFVEHLPVVGPIVDLIGIAAPATAQVATQRTPQPPTYTVTFTVDLVVKSTVTVPDIAYNIRFEPPIPDLSYYVSFANDQSIITSDETSKLLTWIQEKGVGAFPGLRETVRAGKVPVVITGKASVRGHEHADHNFSLSQKRVEAVRRMLQGAESAAKGGRTEGGALGSENVKIDAEADGDFHDPKPKDQDQDRVVQIFIEGSAATTAVRTTLITPEETGKLLSWVQKTVGGYAHLREAIRTGQVPVLITGHTIGHGNAAQNLALSQRQVEAVRGALQGTASATRGGRTRGGMLGSENVKIDAEADGDFHDPQPGDSDPDRVVQVFIDGQAATDAVQRLSK